ncbi:MAG: response regulator [Candidatus Riflebacteria bacterium]|nr:response regulator [Candidatus Riflebacteria bacterium]
MPPQGSGRQPRRSTAAGPEWASSLTRQLLAFSRKAVLQPRVLDLNAVVTDMEKMLRRLIGEDIELTTLRAPDLGRVLADPGQLEQVLMNLAVNARDAMPSGGKLILETENVTLDEGYARTHLDARPGRYAMLAVSDTGSGMTAEVRERIFEPFFTTKDKGKGTGLGLATVYGIVKQSGGSIFVYSEPGKGSSFKIYLPRVDQSLGDDLAEEPVATRPRRGLNVLLVEDSPEVRLLSRNILERIGCHVVDAGDPDEALRLASMPDFSVELLITDFVLPRMSGRDLASRLAASHPRMKILFMSGYTDDAITEHGGLPNGHHFLPKPFTPQGLARKLAEVLELKE